MAARFYHPGQDFPRNSRFTDDGARFTDEGWYSAGAIHEHNIGHWFVAGDFNSIAMIPGWPAILAPVFHVTGAHIVAARYVAICFSVLLVLLGALFVERELQGWGVWALVLLSTSPLLFVFGRMSLLETPMLAFFLAALLCAPTPSRKGLQWLLWTLLFFVAAVMVKTSAMFLLPALVIYQWQKTGFASPRTGEFWRNPGLTGALCLAAAAIFYGTWVHAHAIDVKVLTDQNALHFSKQSLHLVLRLLFRFFTWCDPLLALLGILTVGFALVRRDLALHPVFLCAIAMIGGFAIFSVGHITAFPHYFIPFEFGFVLLTLLLAAKQRPASTSGTVLGAMLWICLILNGAELVRAQVHPTYTYRAAAAQAAAVVRSHPEVKPLWIGHGAVNTTFYTGVEALDDMGSMTVAQKLDTYHPGWILVWEDDKALVSHPDVLTRYDVIPAGTWTVMELKGRNHLLLYELKQK